MTQYRLSGTIGRKICDEHSSNVLLCWCGYIRPDVMRTIERQDMVQVFENRMPIDPQTGLFEEKK